MGDVRPVAEARLECDVVEAAASLAFVVDKIRPRRASLIDIDVSVNGDHLEFLSMTQMSIEHQ